MKRFLGILLAIMLLLAQGIVPAAAGTPAIPDGRWLNSDLDSNVSEDIPADPKDNFALYVNKDWILRTSIPDGNFFTDAFTETEQVVNDRLVSLLRRTDLQGHDAELVHKLYVLLSDWDYRNALGTEPAMPVMEAVAGLDGIDAILAYMMENSFYRHSIPLNLGVIPDPMDTSVNIINVAVPVNMLMMSDSAEYTERTEAGKMDYDMNRNVGLYMLQLLGYGEEEANAVFENALAFETVLAKSIRPNSDHYSADYLASSLNYCTEEELAELAGDFPIIDLIAAYGLPGGKRFLVDEPDYIASLKNVYTEKNAGLIRDWILFRTAVSFEALLDYKTLQETTGLANEVYGITGTVSDDMIVVQSVKAMLRVPLDNLYIQNYCTEKQRNDILEMVGGLLEAYHGILNSADWLSEDARAKAVEKLDHIKVNAIWPGEDEDWGAGLDFAGVEENGTLASALSEIRNYTIAKQAETIGQPVNRYSWDRREMPSYSINAYYEPSLNTIYIMAGICAGVFYDEEMSEAQVLGGLGAIIGHEISHAFDIEGAQLDQDGNYSDWWTEEDYAAFLNRAEKLSAWFDGFIPYEGCVYSGELVWSEAIADMTGMKCALAVAAQKENFDYDAFFRQFARIWRCKANLSAIILFAADVHPYNYLRINATLAQFDEFIDFYGVRPGDGMYLAPEDRLSVW